MNHLLILSKHAAEYRRLVEAAGLPELAVAAAQDPLAIPPATSFEIVFGEPGLIAQALQGGLHPQRMPGLRWVQATWAGVEPLLAVDLRRDYILTNARGVFGPLMAEYVFGYLLLHERRILQRWQAQQAGQWENTVTGTLRSKCLGLLGVGSIGATLAHTARHFGMRVHGYTRQSAACPDVDAYFHAGQLLEFASRLDYLVCVLPNTPATRHIVNAGRLAALPGGALFINAGRGQSVDEAALAQALQSGRLAGAVLDVFEQEPLPAGHVFWRTPNLLITGHTAAPSFPADLAALFIENYRRYLAGQPLLYQVDFERGY
jgi:phosphoglycerate dehydrogenase-like enzyme